MSLSLSDADLARLRLEAMHGVWQAFTTKISPEETEACAERVVRWCLRDREVEE